MASCGTIARPERSWGARADKRATMARIGGLTRNCHWALQNWVAPVECLEQLTSRSSASQQAKIARLWRHERTASNRLRGRSIPPVVVRLVCVTAPRVGWSRPACYGLPSRLNISASAYLYPVSAPTSGMVHTPMGKGVSSAEHTLPVQPNIASTARCAWWHAHTRQHMETHARTHANTHAHARTRTHT